MKYIISISYLQLPLIGARLCLGAYSAIEVGGKGGGVVILKYVGRASFVWPPQNCLQFESAYHFFGVIFFLLFFKFSISHPIIFENLSPKVMKGEGIRPPFLP